MIVSDKGERPETPEARAARLTLAFVEAMRSDDSRKAEKPAGDIVEAVLGAVLRFADAADRLAAATEATATHTARIAHELTEARAFRERERRSSR